MCAFRYMHQASGKCQPYTNGGGGRKHSALLHHLPEPFRDSQLYLCHIYLYHAIGQLVSSSDLIRRVYRFHTESDLRWGWFGSGTEAIGQHVHDGCISRRLCMYPHSQQKEMLIQTKRKEEGVAA